MQCNQVITRNLVPGILIVIVVLQNILTQTTPLTRWKGGGFGMFSTIDSTGARYLKCYLLTSEGDVPVRTPGRFAQEIRDIRLWPTSQGLMDLAEELTNLEWLLIEKKPPSAAVTVMEVNPLIKFSTEPQDHPYSVSLVRHKFDHEKVLPTKTILRVTGIRIELWRERLDPTSYRVYDEEWIQATALKSPTAS